MRTFSPRWYILGCLLLVWAAWSLADEMPEDPERRLADESGLEFAPT